MGEQSERKNIDERILDWWRGMTEQGFSDGCPVDRGVFARLRRCHTVMDALTEQATIGLKQRCNVQNNNDLLRVGLVAAVLCHVRGDNPEDCNGRLIGLVEPENEATALCKIARFRRLLAAETPDECLRAFRRLVALMGGRVNVKDMASALWDWPVFPGQEERAKQKRINWIRDYWDVDAPKKKDKKQDDAT